MAGVALIFDLLAKDTASPAFLRLSGAADKAAASTARATKGVESTAAAMSRTGAKLTKGITLPLLGLGAVAVDQAAKFQKSMTLLQTAGGETEGKMRVISKGIMTVAKSTGTSLGDLSEGMYVVAKAGAGKWSATQQLLVLKAAAQGAKAEAVPLGTAVDALSTVMQDYGAKAGDAVKYENMLIRGSGLAKTSMSEFASSLSNVVPLAASLGIGFDQVAGAIATMTQHGVSAQRATENLNNLIRNLAGQNAVAAGAMGQLGLNTLDLRKKLASNGLTGTLDMVEGALKKNVKGGMVVVGTFKRAQLATASLRTEMAAMPADLQKNAQAFDAGKMSYKDFYAYTKSLGGQQFELAKNFLGTEASARGFSKLLAGGGGSVATAAQMLQKALGGSSGLNVALQLGAGLSKAAGENAKLFGRNVSEVAKAARNSGADVLGWAKTQDTLAVKIDKAKASLQVFAVQAGTALLPIASKIVGALSGVMHWFDKLSDTKRAVFGWSLGILAALGPVLAIGGRLALVGRSFGTFAANAGSKLSLLGGASETTATRVAGAMRRMASGLGGVLAGSIAGQVGGNSSGGWLSSILLGAGGGWALGGPVGAAVGGVSAAIFKGIGLWNDHKQAAGQAAAAEKAWIGQLTGAIDQDNGAIGSHLKLLITQQLTDSGALEKAKKLGLNLGNVIGAAMGQAPATKAFGKDISTHVGDLQRQLTSHLAAVTSQKDAYLTAHPGQAVPRRFVDELNGYTAGETKTLTAQIAAYKAYRDAINKSAADSGKATATEKLKLTALNESRVATGSYTAQLRAFANGSSRAVDGSNTLSASLAKGSVIGDHNRTTLIGLAAAAKAHALQVGADAAQHHTLAAGVAAANTELTKDKTAIEKAAVAAGLNKTQVDSMLGSLSKVGAKDVKARIGINDQATSKIATLTTRMNNIRQNKVPGLRASTQQADNAIARLQAEIDALHGKTIINQVFTKSNMLGSQPGNPHSRHNGPTAKGTKRLADGYATVGESGNSKSWELLHKRGSHVEIYSNAESRAMTGWNNVPGFAAGTGDSKKAAKTYKFGNMNFDSKESGKSAMSAVGSAIGALLGAGRNLNASAADIRSAANGLKSSAKQAKLSNAAFGKLMGNLPGLLNAKARTRDSVNNRLGSAPTATTAYDRLATAQGRVSDLHSSVASAITGSFDISTAGVNPQVYSDRPAAPVSGGSILASIKKAAQKAKLFASLLWNLKKDGLNGYLLSQLAQAGPAAYDQARALVLATPKQLAGINSDYRSLVGSSNFAGSTVANNLYGAGVKSAQGLVNGLLSQRKALDKAIDSLANQMVSRLRKRLGIHSPSRVMFAHGASTGEGFRLGIESKLDDIAQTGNKMGDFRPAAASSSGGQPGGNTVNLTQHIYEQHDAHASANASFRRLQVAMAT